MKIKYSCTNHYTQLTDKILHPNEEGKILWHITNFTPDMDKWKVIWAIEKAFAIWQPHFLPIQFESTKDKQTAHIVISFCAMDHQEETGCPYPFDEQGGILAHAFPPGDSELSGQLHLDENENWQEMHSETGKDLLTVIIHELGHCFNLGHSHDIEAIMFANYSGEKRKLAKDDIEGIINQYAEIKSRINKGRFLPEYIENAQKEINTSLTHLLRAKDHILNKQ